MKMRIIIIEVSGWCLCRGHERKRKSFRRWSLRGRFVSDLIPADYLSCQGNLLSRFWIFVFLCRRCDLNIKTIVHYDMPYVSLPDIPPWNLMNKKRNLILLHENQTKFLIALELSCCEELSMDERNHVEPSTFELRRLIDDFCLEPSRYWTNKFGLIAPCEYEKSTSKLLKFLKAFLAPHFCLGLLCSGSKK